MSTDSQDFAAEYERLRKRLAALETVEDQLRSQNEALTAAHCSLELERFRYQALFDSAPDAYLVTGMEGAIWEANRAAAELLHTPKELLPGQSLQEFAAEPYRDDFRQRLRALHAGSTEKMEGWEIEIVPPHASPFPAALTVVAERSLPAAMAGLRWLIRDVSERRRSERQRTVSLLSRAKAKAARRFEFLAEASALLVGSLDIESSLAGVARLAASFSRAWCFISIAEPDGSLRQLEAAHPSAEFDGLAERLRARCLFGGKMECVPQETLDMEPLGPGWISLAAEDVEHAALLREIGGRAAAILPLRIRERLAGVMTLLRINHSRPYHAADRVLYEDLRRRCALAIENARLYREVVAQREQAEKANRAKDEFVAILGHELRNPLTPIKGWARALKSDPAVASSAVVSEAIRIIERNAEALTRLVGECTDMVKISEGKFRVESKRVDLNQIAATASEVVRRPAFEQGVGMEVDLKPDDPVTVMGDPMRLEQVAANLLVNALKYTPAGGRITIRAARVDQDAELVVTDTGIGIERAYLEQIFEPFRQGAASWLTSRSGLGLGLSIARGIAEMHRGRLWAESAGLGCGSVFRLRLPLAAAAGADQIPPTPPPRSPAGARQLYILLVEDSADILSLLKTTLQEMGHTVAAATNGRAGLHLARATPPGLLISDVKMPLMDGYELIRAIRGEPALAHVPAIALTGFGSKMEIDRAIAAGFDRCITKPAEPEEIASAIGELTRERGAACG